MAEKKTPSLKISVVGGGIAGASTALYLAELGHQISLIDPKAESISNISLSRNGTQASLGILMGYVYRRSTGRSWKLRQRSMKLWPKLIAKINDSQNPLKIKTPLVQLAHSNEELSSMNKIANEKHRYGVELLNNESIEYFTEIFESNPCGGLISFQDGMIEPISLLKAIQKCYKKYDVKTISESVKSLKKNIKQKDWNLYLNNGDLLKQDIIIICASLESQSLLKPLGHSINLEPVLGQVLELEYQGKDIDYKKFPAVITNQKFNLIIKKNNRFLIGATIEKGVIGRMEEKINMQNLNGYAPDWIQKASIKNEWSGIRARPTEEPSPILKTLERGLIINSGHYRNGVLLAPACAEWVGMEINKSFN
tara:strand:- start:502 stop:1602 length:1101 start_codon:yes stop_codon:yes gene_type:complete